MTYGELIKMPDYHLMCSALGPYTPLIDYVGADGDWKSKYIPRTMRGIDINICAYIHDWRYFQGGEESDRSLADTEFLVNMITTIIRQEDDWIWGTNSLRKWRAINRAYVYYKAVDEWGAQNFNYFK